MKTRLLSLIHLWSKKFLLAACLAACLSASSSLAVVSAGGMAVIGYDDDLDSFTIVALETIAAEEVIYFTNNGWSSSQGQFNGAYPDQGAGNESIIKLTVTGQLTKGTIFSSASNGSSWSWTRTGLIPGQVGGFGEFSDLALDFESDQIYAFQGLSVNPLANPTSFIYALHFGTSDYPGFSDSEDSLTGDIPPGLSLGAKTAFAHTDFNFHGDADGNHAAWGLNLSAPAVQALQTDGGHQSDWLNVIGSSANWGAGQPSASVEVSGLFVMPEPGRGLLLAVGAMSLIIRRRRKPLFN